MLRFDVGPTRERQALTQMLDRGRVLDGTKAPEVMLKAFGPIGITNPHGSDSPSSRHARTHAVNRPTASPY